MLRDSSVSEGRCVYGAAATALLYGLATVNPHLWPLALVAPFPILATAPEVSTNTAAKLALFSYALGKIFVVGSESHLVPIPLLVGAHLVCAIVFATSVAAAAEAARRWPGVMAAMVFPALMASFYFAAARESPYGTWGDPANLLAGFTPLVQSAALIGTSGITFIGSLLASGLAVAWYRRRWNMDWQMPAYVTAGVFGIAVLAGTVRMLMVPKTSTLKIGLAVAGQPVSGADSGDISAAAKVVAQYAKLVHDMAPQGVQAVVLPEKVVAVTPRYEFDVEEGFARIASMAHVWLAVGFDQIDRSPRHNIAVLFQPDGKPALEYSQHHINPMFQPSYQKNQLVAIGDYLLNHEKDPDDYQPGHMVALVDPPWGRTAVVTGEDLAFSDTTRELAAVGVKLVLAPAVDWPGSPAVRREKAAMVGGVEGGFSVARAARDGMVSATESRGRELAAAMTQPGADAVAVAEVPVGSGPTIYSRGTGRLFPHLLVLFTVLMLARLGISIRRNARVRQMYALKIATPVAQPVAAAQTPKEPEKPAKKDDEEPEIYRAMTRPPPDLE